MRLHRSAEVRPAELDRCQSRRWHPRRDYNCPPMAEIPATAEANPVISRMGLVAILLRGMRTADGEPFRLSSGSESWVVFDAADAICETGTLEFVVRYALSHIGVEFDAVGGPALGAAPLVFGAGGIAGHRSFLVRPETKGHGVGGDIKGRFVPGDRVLVFEDVVTTGTSLIRAMDIIERHGCTIAAAATLIDRGDVTAAKIERRFGVPYYAMTTYQDYGIEPVDDSVSADALDRATTVDVERVH